MNGRDVTGEFFKHRDRILMPSTSFNTTFHKGLAAGAWLMCRREALTRQHVAARRMPLSLDVEQERYPSNERLETRPSTEAGSGGSRARS